MFSDEGIVHDCLSVLLEDVFELVDVVVLVGRHKVSHGQDLGVIFVGLSFLDHSGSSLNLAALGTFLSGFGHLGVTKIVEL